MSSKRLTTTALIFVSAILAFSTAASAQGILNITKHETIQTDDGSTAQDQLVNQAIEDVSSEYIQDLIGAEKAQKMKDAIDNKIVKNSARYILSISSSNLTNDGNNQYSMDVQLSLSLKALRSMLLENGLMYQLSGPPKVLPMIQYMDRVSARSYGWWYKPASRDHADLRADAVLFDRILKSDLLKIGFYSFSPVESKLRNSVPEPYRNEDLQRVDALFLGDYFKSSIVLRGQIMFHTESQTLDVTDIDVHLQALYSGNGRLLAEVNRTYATEPGPFNKVVPEKLNDIIPKVCQNLVAQLSDIWKRGTFGASIVRVKVKGDLSPMQFEDFQSAVVLAVHDVKAFHERVISAHKVIFNADSSDLPQQVAQSFREAKFSHYRVKVTDVSPDGVTLRVKAL